MAALSITKANVAWVSGPVEPGTAGEALDAGDAVYRAASGKWLKAQADGTTVEAGENGYGMALATADADGARIQVALPGAIVGIGTGTAAIVYAIGTTAGDIVPVTDLVTTTQKVTPAFLGVGTSRLLVLGGAYNAGSVVP